jgi:hypothetical protein
MEEPRSLQLSEELDFQRSAWRWQRVGWAAMGALVLAAAAGLFGQGPLAHHRVTADGLQVRYERIAREAALTTLHVEIDATAVRDSGIEVSLDRRYLERVQVEQVTPQPRRVVTGADALHFFFDATRGLRPVTVRLDLKPRRAGLQTAHLRLADGTTLDLPQLVLP